MCRRQAEVSGLVLRDAVKKGSGNLGFLYRAVIIYSAFQCSPGRHEWVALVSLCSHFGLESDLGKTMAQ
ncbi:hypothetical protein ES702_07137 [subsurface metagenome]